VQEMDARITARQRGRTAAAAFGSDFVRQQTVAGDALVAFRDCVACAAAFGALWRYPGQPIAAGCGTSVGSTGEVVATAAALSRVLDRLLATYPLPILLHEDLRAPPHVVAQWGLAGPGRGKLEGGPDHEASPCPVPAVLPVVHLLVQVVQAVAWDPEGGGASPQELHSLQRSLGALAGRLIGASLARLRWLTGGWADASVGVLVALPGMQANMGALAQGALEQVEAGQGTHVGQALLAQLLGT
jgi:hypothetical protein